jgi:hypothetical protein
MNRIGAFLHWLGTPFRAVRGWVPFTHEGRQTLIYLIFAGAGPALTLVGLVILEKTEKAGQWDIFGSQARMFGWSLFVIVAGLGMFVSIRGFKISREGAEFSAKDTPDAVAAAAKVASDVKHTANAAVAEVAAAEAAKPEEPKT